MLMSNALPILFYPTRKWRKKRERAIRCSMSATCASKISCRTKWRAMLIQRVAAKQYPIMLHLAKKHLAK